MRKSVLMLACKPFLQISSALNWNYDLQIGCPLSFMIFAEHHSVFVKVESKVQKSFV